MLSLQLFLINKRSITVDLTKTEGREIIYRLVDKADVFVSNFRQKAAIKLGLDYDTLVKKIKKHQLPVETFQWYLDLRRYGTVPHAGFGLGIERTVSWICGLSHVRETIPFPRMMHRLTP